MKKFALNIKKHTLFIIIGGLFLISGMILYKGKGSSPIYYVDNKMTKEEAKSLIIEKTKNIMDIYENIDNTFSVSKNNSEEHEYIEVSNYDEVVDSIYTEKGKEELETIKFDNKQFVDKKEDGVYLLKIPSKNSYLKSTITLDNISIKDDIVKANVSFTSDVVNSDAITYYIYEKDITLIKKDDKWFVETFMYPNV